MYRWEKNPINAQELELVIDGWENGIGASPEKGVNIKNCNIESLPGSVRPNWKLIQQSIPNNTSFTFTADSVSNQITLVGTPTVNLHLQQVQVSNSGGALPSGLMPLTKYWLSQVDIAAFPTHYYISSSLANAYSGIPINLLDNGSGTQTVSNTAYNMATINWMLNVPVVNNGLSIFYQVALDSNGQLWVYGINTVINENTWFIVDGETASNKTGNGLAFFVSSGFGAVNANRTYIFAITNNNVDLLDFGAFIASPSSGHWNKGWFALNSNSNFDSNPGQGNHMAFLSSQDNNIYICDGFYIDQIGENPGFNFDPTNPATFFQNSRKLTLATYCQAQCLEELNANLLIGDKNTNSIFSWDKQSTNIGSILRVAETNVWRMKNVDNSIYVLAGTKGHIYQTTGYAFTREMKIPEYLSGGQINNWGGIEKVSGAIIFGLIPNTTASAGVYKLYTNVGQFAGSVVGSLICDETPLDINGNATNATALLTDNRPTEFYFIGCAGAIYGLDQVSKLQNYEAYVESDLIPVGTKLQPRAFSNIEYKLDFAPTSGGVRLSWRPDLNASYTVIQDFDCSGVISDYQSPANITNTQYLQIKAELKGGTGYNTPRLREIRLR